MLQYYYGQFKTYTKVDKIVSPPVRITSVSNHQLTTTLFLPRCLSIPPTPVLWNQHILKARSSEAVKTKDVQWELLTDQDTE